MLASFFGTHYRIDNVYHCTLHESMRQTNRFNRSARNPALYPPSCEATEHYTEHTTAPNPKSHPLKTLFLIWVAASLPALLAFKDDASLNYFVYLIAIYMPEMVVHEFGHFVFSVASGVPAVPYFFATFSLASQPVLGFVLILLAVEGLAAWYLGRRGYILLPCLTITLIFSELFFILLPQFSSPFAIFGGVGGQFLVPVVFLLVAIEVPRLRTVKGCIAFAFLSTVFWRTLIQWTLALFEYRPIPYPRDGTGGGMNLFQDPFTSPGAGAPQGDMEKLIQLHGWTVDSLVRWYMVVGVVLLAAFVALWRWAFLYGYWIQEGESVEPSGSTPLPSLPQSKTPTLPQPRHPLD